MRSIALAPVALLALVACESTIPELQNDLPEAAAYQTDKSLAKPEEVAATLRARATLDALVDPGLFQISDPSVVNDAVLPCTAESTAAMVPVYREATCAGLTGWGFEVIYDDCVLDDGDHISGTMFFSFPGLTGGVPEEATPAEVRHVATSVVQSMGPDLSARYEASFVGNDGGAMEVCGEFSGRVEQRWQREVVDVWLGNLNGRVLWDGTSARMDSDTPNARDVWDGRLHAQYPAGAFADAKTLDVHGVSRGIGSTLPSEGMLTQRGWDSELRVTLDHSTLINRSVQVESGQEAVTVELPRW